MGVRELWGRFVCTAVPVAALITALIFALPPAQAASAPPTLEFVAPSFPVPFTVEGGGVTAVLAGFDTVVHCDGSKGSGQITGPRSTLSSYVFTGCETQSGSEAGRECKSTGAEPEEIRSGQIEADLVFINQFTHQVGMLLAPHGGVYLTFECGTEPVKAIGPFLSPVGPIDQLSQIFTATLGRVGSTQVPDVYEGPAGESLAAVPTGERGSLPAAATGVELGFTIRTAVPIEIKALSSADVELARLNDELTAQIEKRHQEQITREAEERQRLQELIDQGAKKEREAREAAQQRARQLSKALRQCKKVRPAKQRSRCESRAKKKFGPQGSVPKAARV
jgi:hypothetical protein